MLRNEFRRLVFASLGLGFGLALGSCEETGIGGGGDGTACDLPAGSDATEYIDCLILQENPVTMTYTPMGCSHTVTTPAVGEARRDSERFGDAPAPYAIHSSFAGPATTTFAVNWATDLLTTSTHILVGTSESGVTGADGAVAGVTDQQGHSVAYKVFDAGQETFHRVHETHVCGLLADTIYYYKVGGPGHWSPVYEYRTAPAGGSTSSWRFAVTGDSRTPQANRWARSQKGLFDLASPVRLEVFSGDAVFLGLNQNEWNTFFGSTEGSFTVDQFLGSVPFMMANGNHDGLAVNYLAQFAVPQELSEGESAGGEEWYSYDYGNAHFVVLNDTVMSSTTISNEERAFLAADLAAVDRSVTPWVFAVHHKPIYTCLSNHMPDPAMRAAWQPLFDQYEVDIVFAGHNHVYERSKPIRGLNNGDGIVAASGANGVPTISGGHPSGTLYVVSAGVGAELYGVSNTCAFTQAAQSIPNYTIVTLTDRTISVEVRDYTTDSLVDSFTYTK